MSKLRNPLLLLLTATIWGTAFVAQSVGMDYVGPFTFNAVRSIIGGIVLLPVILIMKKAGFSQKAENGDKKENLKNLLVGGVACGVLLFVASNLQQFGIKYTTVGKAGFITAFYIVIVPILGLFFKKKCNLITWIGVFLALAGLYLLCIKGSFSLGAGDLLILACAIVFSCHILVVDKFSPLNDGVKMSCIQFFVCGILSLIMMFAFENPQPALMLDAWLPILYAGVMSCGVAYTLQIVGQKGTNPTVAALILSLESVISVLAGWIILGQTLSVREIAGCAIMFAAIILVQCAPLIGKNSGSAGTGECRIKN